MIPDIGNTYHPGAIFKLYRWSPPPIPDNLWANYGDGEPLMTQITDRYAKSINERISLPSPPPDLSIILEKRMLSSIHRVPHVWSARVQNNTTPTEAGIQYPLQLVVKIYDPTFYDDHEAEYADPFALRDVSLSREVAAYQRLERLQGTGLPKFYGHFITPIPTQQNRTVNAVLLEYVEGTDLRVLVPQEEADAVCNLHKDAVIEAALHLFFEIYALGVHQTDMQPRNMILRPRKEDSEIEYCTSPDCPLRFKANCSDFGMVMVDFEMVDFIDADPRLTGVDKMRECIDGLKEQYVSLWLKNGL